MAANRVRLSADLDDNVSSKLAKIRDQFDLLGGKGSAASLFGNIGANAVAKGFDLIGDAAGKATEFVFDSIDAASNLQEAMSKSTAVFGPLGSEMEAWAKTGADAFGLSTRAALEAAGTYGNLFQAFGLGQDEAAGMSKTLVELAADLASFNNTSMEDAIDALRSGLSGETEPLKRYGVALSDVRLKEEALRLGLIKTTSGVLPIAIKTQAAYALVLKDTKIAQGDYARTQDGLANTQRDLTAAMENAQAAIGEALLPVMIKLATFAKDELVPIIEDLAQAFDDAGKGIADNADAFGNFANILHDLFKDGDEEARTFTGSLVDGLGDAASEFDELTRNVINGLTFWDKYTSVADDAAIALSQTGVAAKGLSDDLKGGITGGFRTAKVATDQFGGAVKTAAIDMGLSAGKIRDGIRSLEESFLSSAKRIIGDYYDPIILKQEQQALAREAAELRETIASKDATTAQIADAKQRLTEIQKKTDEGLVELAKIGKLTAKEQKAAFDDLTDKINGSSGAAQDYFTWLRRQLYLVRLDALSASGALNLGGGIGSGIGGRAHGGPVDAGKVYMVGERGPELFVANDAGTVVPNGSLSINSGGGGAVSLGNGSNVTVNVAFTSIATPSPADGQRIAAAIGPELQRWMRTNQLTAA